MRLFRLLVIGLTIARCRLDRLLPDDVKAPLGLRWLLGIMRMIPAREEDPAQAARQALEQLGPVFIKFGQILSTRRDLLSSELADQLQKLQDQVPPFPSSQAVQVVERAMNCSIDQVFSDFDLQPLASASVAQVHAATLRSGEDVVVKIIRPGIASRIQRDLNVMYLLAGMLERFWEDGHRLHVKEVVADYERTILNELNLQMEAANTAKLRENWAGSSKLYVPEVYWDHCSEQVMVMERIYGIRATDLQALQDADVDLKKLAHLGVDIFFTQVFEHNFFHADMHPGNVFVDISDPDNPSYIALDCAIIGVLAEQDKNYLAENLLAFFRRDYAQVAALHIQSGWVPADTDVRAFEAVIRSVCDPVFEKPISEISFGRVLVSLFRTARQFEMEVQPQLVLLQKTLLNIEGMGRQIYPALDLWETAAPFMERWMKSRFGVRRLLQEFEQSSRMLVRHLPELPELLLRTLQETGQIGEQTRLLEEIRGELGSQQQQVRKARLGGIAVIAALLTSLLPLSGLTDPSQALIGTSILGSIGVYWLYIHA